MLVRHHHSSLVGVAASFPSFFGLVPLSPSPFVGGAAAAFTSFLRVLQYGIFVVLGHWVTLVG